ncbi:threonine/serine exporter family protein [[Clostridium] dakarense]|uniref:threonine/serine ThrE exporter family protein n=1 Tax=Faecalimicrobium dakarense TaxID=1301100 RepID=UPI0004B871FE|nr:threonine/serine exporter family protein [[Clostridium] dakarense]
MDINRVLNFSSNAGKLMLQSGGETYRVEETISRICQSFDVDEVDVFASPTAVIVSVSVDGKVHSIVKRIKSRGIDLNKVHNINSLSRKIYNEKLNIYECEQELEKLSKEDSYDVKTQLIVSGIATSSFTLIFGGSINDIIASFIIGIILKLSLIGLGKSSLNEFFINSIGGAIIAIYSVILLDFGIISQIDKLIAGAIMILVPGLALTNSIRDVIDGQLVSGLTKASEVLLIGISIAVGTGTIIHLYLKMRGI